MDQMAAIRVTFFQECEDQLTALESGLLAIEEGDASADTINAVFRAVHSIKGGAGAFQLNELVAFAHTFETALDKVRSGKLVADSDVLKLFLRAADTLADLVHWSHEGSAIDPAFCNAIIDEFNTLSAQDSDIEADAEDDCSDIEFSPLVVSIEEPLAEISPIQVYKIQFKPFRELYAMANEPIALLREISTLGACTTTCDSSALPDLDHLDSTESYLSWTILCSTEQPVHVIRDVFEFVDGDCALEIESKSETLPENAIERSISHESDIDALLKRIRSEPAADSQLESTQTVKPIEKAPQEAVADKDTPKMAPQPTIRVDLDRVDRLINLIGELVINQAMLSQRVLKSGLARDTDVATSLDELEQLTRVIQESVMAIRAQPVKTLFQRMSRIVREVAEATGKEVRLKTEGDSTEVDKTVVELLADPLTHMVRNAVDHGLERQEDRIAKNKSAEGVIRLSAAHRSGRVVIEVADDGAGINRPRVLEKAIANGLVPRDAQLTDTEIDNLLFLPGFSTASTVSNISGRGVGMDVVKRSIQALGGRITISSKPGQGSVFTMSLPLTLAVLDGIIVSVDDQMLVIPLTAIVETLRPDSSNVYSMGDSAYVIRIRNTFIPLIDVGVELGIRPLKDKPRKGVAILVESENGKQNAFLVDDIQDQRQVVIKSLEANYSHVRGIAAATILGDGRVAMILDVDGIVGNRPPERITSEPPMAMAS